MPTISINNIARAIYDSSKDKSGIELGKVMENTTRFLAEKHLLGKAPEILRKVEELVDKEEGIVRATVSSKGKLHTKTKEEIEAIVKKRYKAKDVILTLEQDENLLGGIKIQVGDEVINMTLKEKLDRLHDYLNNN